MRKSLIAVLCLMGVVMAGCSAAPPKAAPLTPAADLGATEAFLASRAATELEDDIFATGTIGYDVGSAKYELRRGGPKSEAIVGEGSDQFTVITVPGFVFVKAPAAVWEDLLKPKQVEQVENKWVVSNAEGPLGDFVQFTDVQRFFRASGNIKKGKNEAVDGKDAVTLIDPPKYTDSEWWIAAEGTPLLFKTRSGKYTDVAMDYEQINIVELPKEQDVIDFTLVLENRLEPTATPTASAKP